MEANRFRRRQVHGTGGCVGSRSGGRRQAHQRVSRSRRMHVHWEPGRSRVRQVHGAEGVEAVGLVGNWTTGRQPV
jgi:hypothetical protein